MLIYFGIRLIDKSFQILVYFLVVIFLAFLFGQLDIYDINEYFCATNLVSLSLDDLPELVEFHFQEGAVNAAHVLDVEVSRASQVRNYNHTQLFWKILDFGVFLQMLVREYLEKFQINFRHQSLALFLTLLVITSGVVLILPLFDLAAVN